MSRIRLVSLDILTWTLQLVALTVTLERRKIATSTISMLGADEPWPAPAIARGQDHDAEERGILRPSASSTEDIELQPLSSGRTGADEDRERDELLRSAAPPDCPEDGDPGVSSTDGHPLDRFHSGQHVLADMYLLDVVRTEWLQHQGPVPEAGVGVRGGAGVRRRRVLRFSGGRLTVAVEEEGTRPRSTELIRRDENSVT